MTIANVGIGYLLERPAVAGVIVGARLGVSQHIDENSHGFDFALDASDRAKLEAVLAQGTDDLSEAAPLLADLLSIPTGERYQPLNLTPQERKEKTLRILAFR